jgi:signal recognition particle subunit SEC65
MLFLCCLNLYLRTQAISYCNFQCRPFFKIKIQKFFMGKLKIVLVHCNLRELYLDIEVPTSMHSPNEIWQITVTIITKITNFVCSVLKQISNSRIISFPHIRKNGVRNTQKVCICMKSNILLWEWKFHSQLNHNNKSHLNNWRRLRAKLITRAHAKATFYT